MTRSRTGSGSTSQSDVISRWSESLSEERLQQMSSSISNGYYKPFYVSRSKIPTFSLLHLDATIRILLALLTDWCLVLVIDTKKQDKEAKKHKERKKTNRTQQDISR